MEQIKKFDEQLKDIDDDILLSEAILKGTIQKRNELPLDMEGSFDHELHNNWQTEVLKLRRRIKRLKAAKRAVQLTKSTNEKGMGKTFIPFDDQLREMDKKERRTGEDAEGNNFQWDSDESLQDTKEYWRKIYRAEDTSEDNDPEMKWIYERFEDIDEIEKQEIIHVLSRGKRGKSCSNDMMVWEMLWEGRDELIDILKDWVNRKIKNKIKKEEEAEIAITLIPKFRGAQKAKDYRPIALIPVLEKMLGMILHERMKTNIRKEIPEYCHGFVPRRQAGEIFFGVEQITERCAEKGDKLYWGKIDIQKAFDSTPHKAIEMSMRKRNIPEYLIAAYLRSIRGNALTFENAGGIGERVKFFPRRGTLQGHAASPEIFVAVLADALEDPAEKKEIIEMEEFIKQKTW